MSDTPKTDELDEVSSVMSDEETVKAYKRLSRLVERENAALKKDMVRLDWLCNLDCDAPEWSAIADSVDIRSAIDAAMKGTP